MNKTLLFICGAPRSGTTLLANLLSSHPQVGVFPTESKIYFYWNFLRRHGNPERFFDRDYLETPEIKALTDPLWNRQFSDYKKKVYGVKRNYDSEVHVFSKSDWIRFMNYSPKTLSYLYRALMNSTEGMADKDVFVVKCPVYNEVGAVELYKSITTAFGYNVKFIHLKRNPKTRYISAKKRRITKGRFCERLMDMDFPTAHASISMFSDRLAELNKAVIGNAYKVINFEELISGSVLNLNLELTEFLDIEKKYLKQVQAPSSSFKKVTLFTSVRVEQYGKLTNSIEKKIVSLLNYPKEIDGLRIRDFFIPFKNELLTDYWKNRKSLLENLRGYSSFVRVRMFYKLMRMIDNGMEVQD